MVFRFVSRIPCTYMAVFRDTTISTMKTIIAKMRIQKMYPVSDSSYESSTGKNVMKGISKKKKNTIIELRIYQQR